MKRLLGIVGEPWTGVSYVRFAQPFRHLRELGYELVTLGTQLRLERGPLGYRPAPCLLDGIDGVIFPQMVASPTLDDGCRVDLVGSICELAELNGIKIIYSADDHVEGITEANPGYLRIRDGIDNLRTILDHADALFVTTPALGRTLARLDRPIHLLPNAVEPDRWQPRPRLSSVPRLGWAGSSSHVEDLLMVLPAIRRLLGRVPCELVLQGLVERPIAAEAEEVRRRRSGLEGSRRRSADAFLELADLLSGIEHTHVPFGSMNSYFGLLSDLDLDVGICPLLDTEFNRHKSALKFYEYAMCETMTIASDVVPYRDEVSVTVPNDADAWCEAMARYLQDADRREVEMERQREFVLSERSIDRLKHRWSAALESVLGPTRAALGRGAAEVAS